MTVEQFVAARREGWQRLSTICDDLQRTRVRKLPRDELVAFGTLYRQAASDLAYARTQIGNLELEAYLNRLVTRAHGQLYSHRSRGLRAAGAFFAGYPPRWRAAKPFLLVSAALLASGVLTAYLLVRLDPRQALLFVPAEVIESADVLPDAQGAIPASAFVALSGFILTNNLSAGLLAFAGGLFAGLGTIAELLQNGLLLGAVTAVSHNASPQALWQFLGMIAPHGVLELGALVTCGAAGLRLGYALLHGGPVPRLVALRQAGGEAFALLFGTAPWFLVAALLEGCFTPLPLPVPAKLAVAGLTAALLVWYLSGDTPPPRPEETA